MGSTLQDLTKAYLAIEGLLQSRILSDVTRRQLELLLEQLNSEIAVTIRQEMSHGKADDAAAGS